MLAGQPDDRGRGHRSVSEGDPISSQNHQRLSGFRILQPLHKLGPGPGSSPWCWPVCVHDRRIPSESQECPGLDSFAEKLFLRGAEPYQNVSIPCIGCRQLKQKHTTLASTYLASGSRGLADHTHTRRARTSGEFPWTTCPQWLKDAGPFIRDIQFDIIYPMPGPMPGLHPLCELSRTRTLFWFLLIHGSFSVQVVSPGAVLNAQAVIAHHQIWGPFPILGSWIYRLSPQELASYEGQCQRACDEATRVAQSYLPAALPPGVPGFRGYTLRDLRTIAKAFSEPSIYVIQD